MVVAQEKTGYYGLSVDESRPVKTRRRKYALKSSRLALSGFILTVFLVGVMVAYYFSQVMALGYQITCLDKELAMLRVENHSLYEEINRMASLERVQELAEGKLGMVKADSGNVLVVTVAGMETKSEPVIQEEDGLAAGISPAGEEKSRLIKAFTELVNRFENIRLGQGPGIVSGEKKNANNKYFNPEKNNLGFSNRYGGPFRADFPPGLDSAC